MRNERGNGRLGVIIWLAVTAAAIFAAAQIIPAQIAVYEFHDFCEQRARFAATRGGRFDAKKLTKEIMDKAEELGLPVDKKKIKVKRTKNAVKVDVQHSVDVDLAIYTWTWDYDEHYESFRM